MYQDYQAYLRDCVLSGDFPMDYDNWLAMQAMMETAHEITGRTERGTKATVAGSEVEYVPVTACA